MKILLSICALLSSLAPVKTDNLYITNTKIIDLDPDGYALCEESNGELWAIIDNGYSMGDDCILFIDTMGTADPWDDEILYSYNY